MSRVLAVDLGATSVRVIEIDLSATVLEPLVLHRVAHTPQRDARGLVRWDWSLLTATVEHGLRLALSRNDVAGPVLSIGVDTWGVDYGLLDSSDRLLSAPVSYRDERTANWHRTAGRIGHRELFRLTGVQPAGINTMFQLAEHDRFELSQAAHLLMLPDLLIHHLTGNIIAERSIAGTSGLVDLNDGHWSRALIDSLDIPLSSTAFTSISTAGSAAGTWHDIPVTLVHGHDTASAVNGMPTAPATAFVSSGSWLVVGAQTAAPVVTDAAFEAGLTNEPGVGSGNLLVSNVPGFVVVERLLAHWGRPPMEALLATASHSKTVTDPPPVHALADAKDAAQLEALLSASCKGSGAPTRAEIMRAALTSLALGAADAIETCASITGIRPQQVVVGGGGVRMSLFLELLESACGLPVITGPVEATAVGNATTQGIALGLLQ